MKRCSSLILIGSACILAAQTPLHEWQAKRSSVVRGKWKPTHGQLTATLPQGATYAPGKPPHLSLKGDGKSKGGVLISNDLTKINLPTRSITVEAWVKIKTPLKWGGILAANQDNGSYERGFILGYHQHSFFFGIAAKNSSPVKLTYLKSKASMHVGHWYHVVGTYDGETQRIYVDGQLSAESKVQRGDIFYPEKLNYAIGAYWDADEKYSMHGDIESVRVWSQSLDATQIGNRFTARKKQFPGIQPANASVAATTDWRTYRGDNQRSGRSGCDLPADLALHWTFQPSIAPKEAWPGTAQSDHWRKRSTPEKKRITFDKAFSPVIAEGKVYFGSSSEDQIYCVDLETGRHLWSFFTGGPIRLAPTIAPAKVGSQVIFGCDDGYVYSINANTGKLLWKSAVPEVDKNHLPGNGRMISLYPIRTGILVRGNTAYFGCGLFPKNAAAWYCSLDIRSGKIIDRKPLTKSLQGYLEERDGRIFAATGRDPSGAFVATLQKNQLDQGKPANLRNMSIPKEFPYSFLTTRKYGIGGGKGKVALLDRHTGDSVWSHQVPGIARELAIADDKLLVSTDQGQILCFGAKRDQPSQPVQSNSPSYASAYKLDTLLDSVQTLEKILPSLKGYALVFDADADGGKLVHSLAVSTQLQIIGLAQSPKNTEEMRRAFAGQKLYGNRVSIYTKPNQLPYPQRSFNLITSAGNTASLTSKKIKSLLRPTTGVIWLPGQLRASYQAPALKGAGEWTHMYADPGNTACSQDSRVGSSLALQWFGRPGPQHIIDRHLRPPPPLVKNGILITPGNNYIIATDGWNGTVFWEKPIPNMRRIGALRDSGNVVLTNSLLYVASGSECIGLDLYKGSEKLKLKLPSIYPAATHEWGYLATVGSGLIGTAVKKGTVLREMSPAAIYSGGYGDNTTIACSEGLFVLNRHRGTPIWTYPGKGAIFNPSITIAGGKVFFIQSRNPQTLEKKTGRMDYPELIERAGADIVCLDLTTGKKRWSIPFPALKNIQTLFLLAKDGKLITCNSRNQKTVHYDVHCYDDRNGKLLWKQTRNHNKRPNLDHGEQDLHPAIVGQHIIAEPHIYDIRSGKEVGKFNRQGYGCGTISASALSLYFRAGNIATYDLNKKKKDTITSVNRSGCWINMIPAGGLLLVPEGSSGCICNFAVQASMGFAPAQ